MKSILSRDVIEAHKNTKEAAAWRKSRTEYYEALGRYESAKKKLNLIRKHLKINSSSLKKYEELHKDLLLKRDVLIAHKHHMNNLAIEAFGHLAPEPKLWDPKKEIKAYGFFLGKAELGRLVARLVDEYTNLKENQVVRFEVSPKTKQLEVRVEERLDADKN